jgi:hypothetical protein
MKRLSILAAALSILAMGCGTTTPTAASSTNPTTVKFTATLLPSNVVPAITNADASGRGTATITLNLTRDAAGTITAATANFTMDLNSFPAGTSVTNAIIHPGAAGANGGTVIQMGLGAGEIVLVNGTQTGIAKTGVTAAGLTPAVAQDIINNPANYYFLVHTALNGGGAARGQLVKQ